MTKLRQIAASNETALRIMFSAFVVFLIVLPIPPSSVIGFAIIANKRTNRLMDARAVAMIDRFSAANRRMARIAIIKFKRSKRARAKAIMARASTNTIIGVR